MEWFSERGIATSRSFPPEVESEMIENVEEMLKRKIFGSEEITEFSHRIHLRYFAEKIALVSDVAEDVAERLAVYAIKRRI